MDTFGGDFSEARRRVIRKFFKVLVEELLPVVYIFCINVIELLKLFHANSSNGATFAAVWKTQGIYLYAYGGKYA